MSEKPMSLRDTIKPKSDQLNFDDIPAGGFLDVLIVGLAAGNAEQPVRVKIVSDADGTTPQRDFVPCKTVRRLLIAAWGDKGKEWIGKLITLVGDSSVKFGGVEVGGIRVSHLSGISGPLKIKLTTTRGKKAEATIQPIKENT